MSAALGILKRAQAAGLTLTADGDQLRLKAARKPEGELLEALKEHKAELLALLRAEAAKPLFSHDEVAARIERWLAAVDRLPGANNPAGARLKTFTKDFALGPWAYSCIQAAWTDPELFDINRGLVPEMARRALHFVNVSEDAITLMNGRGSLENWTHKDTNDACPWWEDPTCVASFNREIEKEYRHAWH